MSGFRELIVFLRFLRGIWAREFVRRIGFLEWFRKGFEFWSWGLFVFCEVDLLFFFFFGI